MYAVTQFANLCGTVYKQGNVVFTADGNSLVSPVGNRVTVFDLVKCVRRRRRSQPAFAARGLTGRDEHRRALPASRNTSATLPFENRKNIDRIALSPNNAVLITVDEGAAPAHGWRSASIGRTLTGAGACAGPQLDGHALLVNFYRRVVLHHFNFKERVRDIKFSPNGRCVFGWLRATIYNAVGPNLLRPAP